MNAEYGNFRVVYNGGANRRRIRGERGQRLLRQRGERLERPCAHLYGGGGMRRLQRGHENVLKRLLIQVSAFNLGMLIPWERRGVCRGGFAP